jgi:polyhydroxybutyrate depolymerase
MLFAPLLVLMLAPSADVAPKKMEWTIGDKKREALIYLSAKTDKPAPVVFAFHGHGGTAAHAARTFAYQTHWPEAIIVYMQ